MDPAELSRVYSVTPDTTSHKSETNLIPPHTEVAILKERVRGLEDLVMVLNDSQEDLRTRLTNAESERTRLTHLLTHQASQPVTDKSQTSNKWLIGLLVVLFIFLLAGVAWIVHFNHLVA